MERWITEYWIWLAVAAAVIVTVLVVMAIMRESRKVSRAKNAKQVAQTTELQEEFGVEYDSAVTDQGRDVAELDLMGRQQTAASFRARRLTEPEAERYTIDWESAQARFFDDPDSALSAADRLVEEVIAARGYPAGDFDEGSRSLSVDFPMAVQDYRSAHETVVRNRRIGVSGDDLRVAMGQFRNVITELVGIRPGVTPGPSA